jgi:hypothetical protein
MDHVISHRQCHHQRIIMWHHYPLSILFRKRDDHRVFFRNFGGPLQQEDFFDPHLSRMGLPAELNCPPPSTPPYMVWICPTTPWSQGSLGSSLGPFSRSLTSQISGSTFSCPFQKKRLLKVHSLIPFSCEESDKSSISDKIFYLLAQGYAIVGQMAMIIMILIEVRTISLSWIIP